MTISFEAVLFLDSAPSAATKIKRNEADLWGQVINVRSYGATGNNSTDDWQAIQNAFDAAFGTNASPHNNSAFLNRPVYFPAGRYKISKPLLTTAIRSGLIYGDGPNCSQIISTNTTLGTGSVFTAAGLDATISTCWLNLGSEYLEVIGLSFIGADTNFADVELWANTTNHSVTFRQCIFGAATWGMFCGSNSPNGTAEVLYEQCQFNDCGVSGVQIYGQNTLNYNFLRCGFSNCGNNPGAIANPGGVSAVSGSAGSIIGCDFAGNWPDIANAAGTQPLFIGGCTTTSGRFVSAPGPGICHITSCTQTLLPFAGTGGTGGASSTTLTISAVTSNLLMPGMAIFGTGISTSGATGQGGGTKIVKQLSGSTGLAGTYQMTHASTVTNGTAIRGNAVFADTEGGSSIIIDGCSGTQPVIVGQGNNGIVWIRNNQLSNTGAYDVNFFTSCQEMIFQWDGAVASPIVANLPTASASLKGVRAFVTDYNAAVTFSSSVIGHGGGATTVPVWCTGADWVIG